ncbi:MAG: hypothetical protein R3330_15505, partial [Saprospiraceae bacterium]|nr:hypothetical protein [Saprospiraceae bacterium]
MNYELVFPFKGERDYVHGTSIFNAFVELAMQQLGITNGFMDLIDRALIYNSNCLVREMKPGMSDAVTVVISSTSGQSREFVLNPATEAGPTERVRYDEEAICRNSI